MTAEASDAKKYSTSLSSNGMNSEVLSDLGITGISARPKRCGRCSNLVFVCLFDFGLNIGMFFEGCVYIYILYILYSFVCNQKCDVKKEEE